MNKNPKERTEYIGIRVTPEEKEMLKDLAAAAGITLTAYLLSSAFDSKRERSKERRNAKKASDWKVTQG